MCGSYTFGTTACLRGEWTLKPLRAGSSSRLLGQGQQLARKQSIHSVMNEGRMQYSRPHRVTGLPPPLPLPLSACPTREPTAGPHGHSHVLSACVSTAKQRLRLLEGRAGARSHKQEDFTINISYEKEIPFNPTQCHHKEFIRSHVVRGLHSRLEK